jgi:hypothetical protein
MRENDWTRLLGWPGYKVYRSEIDEPGRRLTLWVRRKRGNKQLVCSGCGRSVSAIVQTYQREVRDLPWSIYHATVVVELHESVGLTVPVTRILLNAKIVITEIETR